MGRVSAPRHGGLAWVLIAVFLLQPILTYLVTPVMGHDVKGQLVVVCTLQGEKLVELHLPAPANAPSQDHCPALTLLQMAGAGQVEQPPVLPAVTLYSVEVLDQTAHHQHHSLHFSAYTTRAPPIV